MDNNRSFCDPLMSAFDLYPVWTI